MSSRRSIAAAILALPLALPFASFAAEDVGWLADRDIGSFCNQFLVRPESPSGTVCLSYIQGYLDGLRTTAVPSERELEYHQEDVSAEEQQHISAMRMNALVEEYGPPARAGICLPAQFEPEEIARVIARELRHGRGYSTGALDDYAQAALRERYPCDTSDPVEDQGPPARMPADDEQPQDTPLQHVSEDDDDDAS